MHELAIATAIIAKVQEEMTNRNLAEVTAVGVRVGALSGIDPEALAFGFEAGTLDTPLAGINLMIEKVPVKGKCLECNRDFQVEDYIFLCPYCQSREIQVMQGEELDITYLQVD